MDLSRSRPNTSSYYLVLVQTVSIKCSSSSLQPGWFDFAAHYTIHASKILHFTWKVLSLRVIHLPIAERTVQVKIKFP